MFSMRGNRTFAFGIDITDSERGKKIVRQSQWLMRVSMIVVLSYIWQTLVLEVVTISDESNTGAIPQASCGTGYDCFRSDFCMFAIFDPDCTASIPCDFKIPIQASWALDDFVSSTDKNGDQYISIADSPSFGRAGGLMIIGIADGGGNNLIKANDMESLESAFNTQKCSTDGCVYISDFDPGRTASIVNCIKRVTPNGQDVITQAALSQALMVGSHKLFFKFSF